MNNIYNYCILTRARDPNQTASANDIPTVLPPKIRDKDANNVAQAFP